MKQETIIPAFPEHAQSDGGVGRIQTALRKAREEFGPAPASEEFGSVPVAEKVAPLPPRDRFPTSLWSTLPICEPDARQLNRNRIVTTTRSDPAYVAFDMLRTKVLQLLRQNKWDTVLITSPTPQCGKTLVSLNLAFSLANQKDCRTLLVDLDLHRPQIGALLGVRDAPPLEDFLAKRIGAEQAFRRYGENIAIAPNGRPVTLAAELLQSPGATRAVRSLKPKLAPDVVIFDLPRMLANDDVAAFLPNVDCAILVVAAEQTTRAEVDLCERELSQKTNLLGVVLNKCRYAPEKYGY